ncbi:GNAT family N-acetyltransferase [Niabella terrae]
MQLTEVTSAALEKAFLEVNVVINQEDPNYIRPLDKDITGVFNPEKNKAFRFGQAIRWILKDDQGRLIGRIAAFVNKKYKTKGDEGPVGGMGFFDCINDQAAANLLLDQARNWLEEQGMTAMDGPINFGERDTWWGLLVEGYEPPLYRMNYNQPYYRQLLETYGFQPFFNQICFAMNVQVRLQEKFYSRHAQLSRDPDFSSDNIKKNQLEKYTKDFTTVYNKAWAGHGGLKQLDERTVLKMFRSMKAVMDERINWIIYYKKEPIGIWINLPDLNQWFRFLNGKFSLLDKLKFLWYKKTKPCNKFVGLVFGIIPEFQGRGADAYMIIEGCKLIQNLKIENGNYQIGNPIYEKYELQWIGDFNPKMINVAESLEPYRSRALITYRYNFDRQKPFKPHPILN